MDSGKSSAGCIFQFSGIEEDYVISLCTCSVNSFCAFYAFSGYQQNIEQYSKPDDQT
jgi:hypothetical protein